MAVQLWSLVEQVTCIALEIQQEGKVLNDFTT